VGTYLVVVTDNVGLTASTNFVVTATSTLTVNPSTAPVGVTGVALTVTNFGATATVSFFIYNTTATYPLAVVATAPFTTTTNASGVYLATFTVPPLALGSYFIMVNETSGMWNATAAFNIGAATLEVNTRATTYVQGDTVSWSIQSTFVTGFDINIYDPVNTPSKLSIVNDATFWTPVGALWVYPIASGNGVSWSRGSTFALPNDAVVGTWTWNASITVGTTLTVKSGTFTVTAPTAVTLNTTSVNTALSQINTTVNTMNTKLDLMNATLIAINGNVATLSTNVGYVLTNVTAIGANVTSIKGTVATIQTALGTLQTSVNNINGNITSITTVGTTLNTMNGKLDSISGAVSGIATISTTVGTIQTSLSDIGAKVTSIQTAVGGIATIQTDLGTLTGTVTSIQGNVATIQTNLGTLQTDVTGISTDVKDIPGQVNVPIWIAVVLALIAALAAIASLLLVRRKIAG
jgi:prefoldin subunit 5